MNYIKNIITTCIISLFFLSSSIAGDDEKAPLDPSFVHGKLENGFTYYIRQNKLPEERAYMYLLVNAGSMNETIEQNGLAHFCEHMAFNGTEHYPEHSLKKYLESYGMSFGGGFNAYTSYDRTVYMLNKIPTTNKGLMDSCYLIMYDWASKVKYETIEINRERGVIHEEWRVRGGANRRLSDKTNPVYFNDSRYAKHNVIGDLDVIDNCDPELLRDFYKEWYRPDNQAIVVVGDVDIEETVEKIKSLFGSLEKPAAEMREIDFSVPENKGVKVAIATDPEARNTSIRFAIRHPKEKDQNIASIKEDMLRRVYFTMLSNRYNELATKPNPPYINGYSYYGGFSKDLMAMYAGVIPMQDKPLEGFNAVLLELERVKKYGFTQSEFDRAITNILSSYDKSYKDKDKRQSGSLGGTVFGHFLEGNQAPGLEFDYELANAFFPTITLNQVNELTPGFFKEDFQAIVLHAPEKEGVVVPSEDELLAVLNKVKNTEVEAYVDDVADVPLVPKEPKSGSQISSTYVPDFDGQVWKLSNGAKVVWKYTDNKDDQILLHGYSPGGSSLYKDEEMPSTAIIGSAIYFSGIGEFSQTQLKKQLTGKQMQLNPWVSDEEEGFSGNSSVKDFETMLQLLYLNFTMPRQDEEAFGGYIQRLNAYLKNRSADPNTTFSDSLQIINSNYNPRVRIQDLSFFEDADYSRAMEIYSERMQNANDFTFIFTGNVDTTTMKPLVEKYIGGISSGNRVEEAKDNGIRPPEGIVKKRFSRDMKEPKGYSYLQYWGYTDYTRTNDILMSALRYIVNIRCVEKVREDEGGTYGVNVSAYISKQPEGLYKFYTKFNCDPVRVDTLTQVIYGIIDEMTKSGPTDEEIQAAKEYFLKMKSENLKSNGVIQGAVKKYLKEGYYPYQKEYYEDQVEKISNESILTLAQQVFGDNILEIIMTPTPTEE